MQDLSFMHSFEIASLLFTITPKRLAIFVILAIVIAVIFRFAFDSKRDTWFKRTPSTIFHLRGALGAYLSLGYPTCPQGYLVVLAIILCSLLSGLILFALPPTIL